jgi:hypothetical protein
MIDPSRAANDYDTNSMYDGDSNPTATATRDDSRMRGRRRTADDRHRSK